MSRIVNVFCDICEKEIQDAESNCITFHLTYYRKAAAYEDRISYNQIEVCSECWKPLNTSVIDPKELVDTRYPKVEVPKNILKRVYEKIIK